jgi:hypothetical protein
MVLCNPARSEDAAASETVRSKERFPFGPVGHGRARNLVALRVLTIDAGSVCRRTSTDLASDNSR